MKTRRQVLIIFLACITVVALVAGVNYFANPFGAFAKDTWYSYAMTRNPRTAKISYLQKHHEDYNAYVLGSSGSSALVKETLDEVTGENFYNLFYYGADMKDVLDTAKYIVNTYEVKEIVLPITFSFAEEYDTGESDIHYMMKPEVTGKSKASFYTKYLFADPLYVNDMRRSYGEKTYTPKVFDVFIPESGNYDKRVRDVEGIGDLSAYLEKYPDYQYEKPQIKLKYMDEFFRDFEECLNFLKEKGISYKVLMYPLYESAYKAYSPQETEEFMKRLVEITDFYDFTYTSISKDPRFFYDTAHYRNAVGDMMINKIYGKDFYMPDDFGTYVAQGSDYKIKTPDEKKFDTEVKVLMLHEVCESPDNYAKIDREKLVELFDKIRDRGYKCLTLKEMEGYVLRGESIPDKSVMLTFDDGYSSNYHIVYPLLKEYGYTAVYFPIGHSIGKDTYKDTGEKIIPHYSEDEIKEMFSSGVVEFGTHGYDIHQSAKLEENLRENILRLEGESEDHYIEYIKNDFATTLNYFTGLGINIDSMAYPLGVHDDLSDVLVREAGITKTFTTEEGSNYLIKGLPQSMFSLNRYNVYMDTNLDEIFK